jgi:hypothetical protein
VDRKTHGAALVPILFTLLLAAALLVGGHPWSPKHVGSAEPAGASASASAPAGGTEDAAQKAVAAYAAPPRTDASKAAEERMMPPAPKPASGQE